MDIDKDPKAKKLVVVYHDGTAESELVGNNITTGTIITTAMDNWAFVPTVDGELSFHLASVKSLKVTPNK